LPVLPPWLDYTVEIAGITLTSSNGLQHISGRGMPKAGNSAHEKSDPRSASSPEILASAVRADQGAEYLRVQLHFISPRLFYARQQTRTYLFGGLITIAALAALVGFFSARRAFLRQHQLSELKSNFVSSVSHELRAPIASMRLLAESLQRGKVVEPARQADYFRFLVQECRRLSGLIENVLNFARIEQGRQEYEREPTDVLGLLQQTIKVMEPAAAEKQVHLALTLPAHSSDASPMTPMLDGPAIQQALVNLIDNALKHSAPGGTVTVGFEMQNPLELTGVAAGTALRIHVRDNGPGIPPEDHERIFERFYRRGSELRRETQGIGIGLSIVKHIAEAHGGRVTVESQVGQGSRFTLELPVAAIPPLPPPK
jgi:signal transduction histidine kinase